MFECYFVYWCSEVWEGGRPWFVLMVLYVCVCLEFIYVFDYICVEILQKVFKEIEVVDKVVEVCCILL
jgi:hypothetical protein